MLMIPFPIVSATAFPKRRPMKFPTAANATALIGVRTRVAMIVEME